MPSLLDAEKERMIGTTLLWIAGIIIASCYFIGSLYLLKIGPWPVRVVMIALYIALIGMYLVEQGI